MMFLNNNIPELLGAYQDLLEDNGAPLTTLLLWKVSMIKKK